MGASYPRSEGLSSMARWMATHDERLLRGLQMYLANVKLLIANELGHAPFFAGRLNARPSTTTPSEPVPARRTARREYA